MINRLISAVFTLLLPAVALAEGAEPAEHGAEGIPVDVIYQAINFFLFAGVLVYFLRKPVIGFFKNRQEDFRQALVRAESARRDAEQRKVEIQDRLSKLDSSSSQSLDQARAEAAALKQRIIQDAKDLTKNLREEANRSAQAEIDRAKNEVRQELLEQSIALSRKILAEKMADPDQKRLQTEFVDKIQVVP